MPIWEYDDQVKATGTSHRQGQRHSHGQPDATLGGLPARGREHPEQTQADCIDSDGSGSLRMGKAEITWSGHRTISLEMSGQGDPVAEGSFAGRDCSCRPRRSKRHPPRTRSDDDLASGSHELAGPRGVSRSDALPLEQEPGQRGSDRTTAGPGCEPSPGEPRRPSPRPGAARCPLGAEARSDPAGRTRAELRWPAPPRSGAATEVVYVAMGVSTTSSAAPGQIDRVHRRVTMIEAASRSALAAAARARMA